MINNLGKIVLLGLCILIGVCGFSQSKKKQIEQLRRDIDSLNANFNTQAEELQQLRKYADENNNKIFNLKVELNSLRIEFEDSKISERKINSSLLRMCTQNSVNQEFDEFVENFLETCYWGKNIDSLAFVSAIEIEQYLHPNIGLARYFNPGAFCYLNQGDLGYYFNGNEFGCLRPVIENYRIFKEKLPEEGFCDESPSSDGVYYKSIDSFPDYFDPSQEYDPIMEVSIPTEYKVTQKIRLEILNESWIDKIMYFAEIDGVWYLVYFMDCDCSA